MHICSIVTLNFPTFPCKVIGCIFTWHKEKMSHLGLTYTNHFPFAALHQSFQHSVLSGRQRPHTFFLCPETSLADSVMQIFNVSKANSCVPRSSMSCQNCLCCPVLLRMVQIPQSDSKVYKKQILVKSYRISLIVLFVLHLNLYLSGPRAW